MSYPIIGGGVMSNNLRGKVLTSVVLILLLTTGMFVGYGIYQSKVHTNMLIAYQHKNVQSIMEASTKNIEKVYSSRIEGFVSTNPDMIEVFAKRDRESLYQMILPKYKILQSENKFFEVIHIHLPDGHTFLRMHKPDKYGDDLSKIRPLIQRVHNNPTDKVVAGFEVGKHNAFFRVIKAIFWEGKYIGAMEFGIDVCDIEHHIRHAINVDTAVYISDRFISPELDIPASKMKDSLGDYTIVSYHGIMKNFPFEKVAIDKDNSSLSFDGKDYILHSHKVLKDYKGEYIGGIAVLQDITEDNILRKKFLIQSLLFSAIILALSVILTNWILSIIFNRINKEVVTRKKTENKYKNLTDNSNSGIWQINREYQTIYMNPSMISLLEVDDYSKALEIPFQKFIDEKYLEIVADCFNDMLEGEPCQFEIEIIGQKGKRKTVLLAASPVFDENDKLDSFLGIFTDVSKEKKALKNLHKAEEKYRSIFENAVEGIYQSTTAGKLLNVNPAMAVIFGYETPEEMIDSIQSISEQLFVNPNDRAKLLDRWGKEGVVIGFETKFKKKNGEVIWLSVSGKSIRDARGNILFYEGSLIETTEVHKLNKEIINTQKEVVTTLGEVVENRSKEAANHVKRVAEYSYLMAIKSGLTEKEARLLQYASPMHDVGKIGIEDSILLKPRKLTAEEFEKMKTHTTIGHSILKNSKREVLQTAAIVANEHHERWDGEGYPNQLSGENIHIFARITAIADVFDALSSKRVYKDAWPMKKVILVMKEGGESGQFDPTILGVFLENMDHVLKIKKDFPD